MAMELFIEMLKTVFFFRCGIKVLMPGTREAIGNPFCPLVRLENRSVVPSGAIRCSGGATGRLSVA